MRRSDEIKTDHFIKHLTQNHRVVVLDRLGVIAHGFSRSTYDGDIWLDPMASSHEWASDNPWEWHTVARSVGLDSKQTRYWKR